MGGPGRNRRVVGAHALTCPTRWISCACARRPACGATRRRPGPRRWSAASSNNETLRATIESSSAPRWNPCSRSAA